MEKLTRRSFVKRSGAVTLGSVLGLGVLPSLTRKLHATDLSMALVTGVSFNWPAVSMVTKSRSGKGEIELGIAIDADAPKGQCNLTATMHIYRYAIYRETRNGSAYFGCSWDDCYYTWHCMNGVVGMKSGHGTSSGPATIYNNAGENVGAICATTSTDGYNNCMVYGQLYQDDEWKPKVPHGPLIYTPSCCVIA